jgi:hypothetical protein
MILKSTPALVKVQDYSVKFEEHSVKHNLLA